MRPAIVALWLLSCVGPARAGEALKLKMAAIAPDGTAWARELKALSRDVETGTGGAVTMRWLMGGIAGDEMRALERLKTGQLDGMAGAIFCERLAPSLRAMRVVGLVHDRDEQQFLVSKMRVQVDAEFDKSGVVALATGDLGSFIVFSRNKVASMADLKREKLWVWSLDDVLLAGLNDLGIRPQALPIEEAAAAYDSARIDGFITVPTAALAFQWTARARYFTELHTSQLPGCLIVSRRAFDAISIEHQQAIRAASAKFAVRFNDLGRTQDDSLLGGLLERQGIKKVPLSAGFRDEFYAAAAEARARIKAQLVPAPLIEKVGAWLAELRGGKK